MRLLKLYKSKWRSLYDGKLSDLGKDTGGLKWLEKNWQKTRFKSYEAAKEEFDCIMDALMNRQNAVSGLEELMVEAIIKYGPGLSIDIFMELHEEHPDKF